MVLLQTDITSIRGLLVSVNRVISCWVE